MNGGLERMHAFWGRMNGVLGRMHGFWGRMNDGLERMHGVWGRMNRLLFFNGRWRGENIGALK